MARTFCIPGIIVLFAALVLSIFATISLPYVHFFDLVRVHFNGDSNAGQGAMDELRLGIWGWCYQPVGGGSFTCQHPGHAYSLILTSSAGGATEAIGASWTRGLILHPIATGITAIAFLLSFSEHLTVTLLSSLTSFIAALFTLIAFAIDIALYVYVHNRAGKLQNVSQNTSPGPSFYFTLIAFVLLLVAGCIVCFGRRRDRFARGYSPSSGSRFRMGRWGRNKYGA